MQSVKVYHVAVDLNQSFLLGRAMLLNMSRNGLHGLEVLPIRFVTLAVSSASMFPKME